MSELRMALEIGASSLAVYALFCVTMEVAARKRP